MIRRHAALLAGAMVLALGGCSEEPEPRVAPTPSASPSPAVIETPTTAPEPWEVKSEDGAVAFARHWIDVFNAAQADGRVGALRELSAKGCGTCASIAERVESLYADGGRIESGGWLVQSTAPTTEGLSSEQGQVALRIDRTPQQVFTATGMERFPGSPITLTAQMRW